MLKQIALLKRRPGMSLEEFIAYYENNHAKLGTKYMPLARRYLRRYVHPVPNPMTRSVEELAFDAVTEIWWDSREDFESTMTALGEGQVHREFMEDEERLFSSHANPVFTVEEHDSTMKLSWKDIGPGMLKQVTLLKRRPGMTIDEFKNYYETTHAKLGQQHLPLARRYFRRYVRPEPNPITREVEELDFDVIMEIWWGSQADFEANMKDITPDIQKLFYDDEERLFDKHNNPTFTVDERESAMSRPWSDD
jgi:hypothetical protein